MDNTTTNSRYLIFWLTFCSGGLCDRILGLSSAYCISKLLNMKLLIKWDHCDLTNGFTINDKYNWYKNNVNYRFVNLTNIDSIDYFKNINIVKEWNNDNIMIWSNVNLFSYLLLNQNDDIKNILKNNKIIDNESAIIMFSNAIKTVFNDIFIINPEILDKFNNIPIYEIGIHIRTGDKQIYNKENETFYENYISNIFKKIKNHMKISNLDNIFLSSDCLLSHKIALDYFDNIHYNEGPIIHTSEVDKIYTDGIYKVLLDLLTLSRCSKRLYIGWDSNFSRIPALFNINRDIICYEYERADLVSSFDSYILFSYFSKGKYT